jgi:ABC-type branched-subunit amino acid transport system substrate-binding protein
MAYTTTSPEMSDQQKYPYFTRTIESTSLHNPAIVKILRLYGWKRVAIISEDADFVIGVSVVMVILFVSYFVLGFQILNNIS